MRIVFDLMNGVRGLTLDCGCGTGFFCKAMENIGNDVIGIDINTKVIRIASRNVQRTSLIICDATHLPFRGECFSHIICSDVLEHIPNDENCIEEMERVLKSDGEITITTPLRKNPRTNKDTLKKVWQIFHHVREGYTLNDLKSLVQPFGLCIVRTSYYWGPILSVFFKIFHSLPRAVRNTALEHRSEQTNVKDSLAFVFNFMFLLLALLSLADSLLPVSFKTGLGALVKKT